MAGAVVVALLVVGGVGSGDIGRGSVSGGGGGSSSSRGVVVVVVPAVVVMVVVVDE